MRSVDIGPVWSGCLKRVIDYIQKVDSASKGVMFKLAIFLKASFMLTSEIIIILSLNWEEIHIRKEIYKMCKIIRVR